MRRTFVVVAAIATGLSGCGSCGKSRGLSFDPPALPEGKVGQPYHVEVQPLDTHTPVGGMSLAEEAGALPPGLSFEFTEDAGKAVIDGTPTAPGTFDLTVTAWCYGTNVSGQQGHVPYRIVIR